ncbi:hypothetical protein C5167_015420 [Papaver somniferum]|uniref:Uncharacterized protein n=1 Tax=Papaver somniferum TaxID=3469 RepID=A0A4Y7J937_PAPSO|nr:hypothetical protein C5167_015420 [Papaver somniferum]
MGRNYREKIPDIENCLDIVVTLQAKNKRGCVELLMMVVLLMVFEYGHGSDCSYWLMLQVCIDGCGHEAVAGRVVVAEMEDMVLSGGGLNCWLSTDGAANM